MGFSCGIVGLPNVGKSTLFNALTATQAAEAANYPFCTIEPNVGRVAVPDGRLDQITDLAKAARTVPTQQEFVDIAGLVRGASRGEGLGNKFLAHIREVGAVVQVLRCFADDNVTHVEKTVDASRDADIIATELMLADLESLERRALPLTKKARTGERDAKAELAVIEPVLEALRQGRPARTIAKPEGGKRGLHLLTDKPMLYVCNVDEADAAAGNAETEAVAAMAAAEGAASVVISAKIEAEVALLSDAEERNEYLAQMGLGESGLDRVVRAGYGLLGLITFFTASVTEARAWTVRQGTLAPGAAGTIHGDFERGFICAETIAFDDYVACGGEAAARDVGKLRQEGRNYRIADGDIIHFRFNV
jgi:ribosome-binding ATPase